jgi:hypothetical protein
MPDIEVGGKALISQSGTANPIIKDNVTIGGHIVTLASSSPETGQIYIDSTTKSVKIYNGSHWVSLGGGPSASGGAITFCGGDNGVTYRVHKFMATHAKGGYTENTNHTFTVTGGSITADILMVGGGGAGGSRHAGGGGAGGVLHKTGATLAAGSYALVIGAGGQASFNTGNRGGNGSDTTGFGAIAKGGGGGGGYASANNPGNSGGSGGGGAGSDDTAGGASDGNDLGSAQMAGGTTYGNEGAYGWYPGDGSSAGQGHNGGGGGGAGYPGNSYGSSPKWSDESLRSSNHEILKGGDGIQIDIDGNNYYWGGGGGGSTYNPESVPGQGGLGGGGGGGHSQDANDMGSKGGTGGINPGHNSGNRDSGGDAGYSTGGGGGGCGQYRSGSRGGYGGSGIVIIRYAI